VRNQHVHKNSAHAAGNPRIVTPLDIVTLESALATRARELARSLAERNQIAIERSVCLSTPFGPL
jgi:hypothetical protein